MAVYEHTYENYAGATTPTWSRFLILPRYAYADVFASKLFVAFFSLCFVCPLVASILIYLQYNTSALAIFQLSVENLLPINADFFRTIVGIQGMCGFFLTLIMGPPLIARDTANNGLPLYLCRPFSRAEYVAGKMATLLILLSLITWIPILLLFFFRSYLAGFQWFIDNLWIADAILWSSLTWIVTLALLCLALSAWLKWRMASSAALFGVFFIPGIIGTVINELFNTKWGDLINIGALIETVSGRFFRSGLNVNPSEALVTSNLPFGVAVVMLILIGLFCLWLIRLKVRAYEVIK